MSRIIFNFFEKLIHSLSTGYPQSYPQPLRQCESEVLKLFLKSRLAGLV